MTREDNEEFFNELTGIADEFVRLADRRSTPTLFRLGLMLQEALGDARPMYDELFDNRSVLARPQGLGQMLKNLEKKTKKQKAKRKQQYEKAKAQAKLAKTLQIAKKLDVLD